MKLVKHGEHRSVDSEEGKFTDGVWQEELLTAQAAGGMRVHRFFYAPGSHSHWHSHTGEQALLVIAGTARIKKDGEGVLEASPGDVVYVAPNEKHWHGAGREQFLVHYAFTASGSTDWFEAITDEEYWSARAKSL